MSGSSVIVPIEPPYAADVRVKGWKFEVDHERVAQSDTWALAPPAVRPWLLMLWLTSWQQSPAGSLPADHQLIAARIGMEDEAFAQVAKYLLRGWRMATDGRLYHPVLTELVLEMLRRRRGDADRRQRHRDRGHGAGADVTHKSRVTLEGSQRDSIVPDAELRGEGLHRYQNQYQYHEEETTTAEAVVVRGEPGTPLTDKPGQWSLAVVAGREIHAPSCPHEAIIAAYHRLLPMLPQVREWTQARRALLATRWRERAERQTVAWWENLFAWIAAECPFLIGQGTAIGDREPFLASLEWIVRPKNFPKVVEGHYQRGNRRVSRG